MTTNTHTTTDSAEAQAMRDQIDDATLALASATAQLDMLLNFFDELGPASKELITRLGLRAGTIEVMIHSAMERIDTASEALGSDKTRAKVAELLSAAVTA